MSAKYEVGDVAMVECSDGVWRRATCEPHPNYTSTFVWRFPDRVFRHQDSPARPLAVIDPEDREQVERLVSSLEALSFSVWGCGAVSAAQAALREFAKPEPPKPEEPTGRFAEVVDANGVHWFRLYPDLSNSWAPDDQFGRVGSWRAWADINAVEILSAGWSS